MTVGDVFAYRLSLAAELEVFRPEIEHALTFVEDGYLVCRDDGAARVLHYGPTPKPDALWVPSRVFPDGIVTDGDGVHPVREVLARLTADPAGGLLPSGGTDGPALGFDAIGLIFLCLSRVEERGTATEDRYGRFPALASLLPTEQGRLPPWADRAADRLIAALTGQPRPSRRGDYTLWLSHDVDRLRTYHRRRELVRHAAGDVLRRGRPRAAVRRVAEAVGSGEPWASARRLMALSEGKGVPSRFYFMGPSRLSMDSPYALTMPRLLAALAGEITARGHVIGFHPGFGTGTDPALWRTQKAGLEAVVGRPVTEGRQHVLHWRAEATPAIWADNGMATDTTPAYPEITGFRSGSTRSHRAYDLRRRRTLSVRLLDTPVMEFGLLGGKYRDLTVDAALQEAAWAADQCREHGGTFSVLFHTGLQTGACWTFYERLLAELA